MELSLDYIPEVTMRRAHKFVKRAIVKRQLLCMYSASGSGKTTMTDQLAQTVTEDDLKNHPLNIKHGAGTITHVVTYDCPAPMYDDISWRGPIMAGETYVCSVTGATRIRSDLASPVWFMEVMQLMKDNPNAHILFKFDEVNLGSNGLHSSWLPFIDRKGVGPHQFIPHDRERLSFLMMGNPPEALPSENNMSGPLAQRVKKWIKVKTDNTDVKTHLEDRGELAGEVERFFSEHDSMAEVAGVDDNGRVPGLDLMDNGDDKKVETFLTPIVNGISPRKWHEISLELIDMRHSPDYQDMPLSEKREELNAMVHGSIADELVNNMELMDTFATMDDVVHDPATAMMPDGLLLQSMQIRSLLPRLDDQNVKPFIKYADRFSESARSGIMAYLLRQMQNAKQKVDKTAGLKAVMGQGGLKLSNGTMKELADRYLKGAFANVAAAIGTEDIVLAVDVEAAPQVQAPAPSVPNHVPPAQPAQAAPAPVPPAPTPATQAPAAPVGPVPTSVAPAPAQSVAPDPMEQLQQAQAAVDTQASATTAMNAPVPQAQPEPAPVAPSVEDDEASLMF